MESQRNKRVAIVSANDNAYSETFIKAQVDLLPASVFLHSGWLPSKFGDKNILNRFKTFLNHYLRPIIKIEVFPLEREIAKLLKKEKIEAVLAQYGPGGCAMINICKKTNIPLFVHFLGFDTSHAPTLETYSLPYIELFRVAKGIISVSKKMTEKLMELGCPSDKIVYNPCGPNDIFFNSKPTYANKTFFGYGRFVDKKAPHLTILAFKETLKKYNDAKLIIGGDGYLLHACRTIIKAYNMEKNVLLPGILTQNEAILYMENSLAFVQHSVIGDFGDSEGTPVAILEASAAALPIISTFHAGIPEVVINNVTGILVNECDVSAMSDAMIKLIEDNDLAKNMGMAGREKVLNNFSMGKYIYTLRDLVNRI